MITSQVFNRCAPLLVLCTISSPIYSQTEPDWWNEYGIAYQGGGDDYAVVNQGQLKNIALKTYLAFDEKIPNGAGEALYLHVSQFFDFESNRPKVKSTTDDYAAANIGQLKAISLPFYTKLIELGELEDYPWVLPTDPEYDPEVTDDFALANIGQVKNLFAFDLELEPANPSIGFSNGKTSISLAPNEASTISVTLANLTGGIGNRDVFVSVISGEGYLGVASTPAPDRKNVKVVSNSSGLANVYIKASDRPGSRMVLRFSISADLYVDFEVYTKGHVAKWLFNEGRGSVAVDSSGWERHLTLSSSNLHREESPAPDGIAAVEFDAAQSSTATIEDVAGEINFGTGSLTILTRVQIPALSSPVRLISRGFFEQEPGYFLGLGADGKIRFGFGKEGPISSLVAESEESFDDDEWHNIALVLDREAGGEVRLVVDGVVQNVRGESVPPGPWDESVSIGGLSDVRVDGEGWFSVASRNGEDLFLSATLDHLELLRGALSNSEISTLHAWWADTDSDGIPDGLEQELIDADPNDGVEDLADIDGESDFDGDGIKDIVEHESGSSAVDYYNGEKPSITILDGDGQGLGSGTLTLLPDPIRILVQQSGQVLGNAPISISPSDPGARVGTTDDPLPSETEMPLRTTAYGSAEIYVKP